MFYKSYLFPVGAIAYSVLYVLSRQFDAAFVGMMGACVFIGLMYLSFGVLVRKKELVVLVLVAFTWFVSPFSGSLLFFAKLAFPILIYSCVASIRLPCVQRESFLLLMSLAVVVPLIASLLLGGVSEGRGEVRFSGVFVNANNLALFAFLVPLVCSTWFRRYYFVGYLIAFAFISYSGTMGALLSMLASILYHSKERLKITIAVVVLGGLLYPLVVASDFTIIDKVKGQLSVLWDLYPDGYSSVDFGVLLSVYGEYSLSGVWRIVHWASILQEYCRLGPFGWLYGAGLGASSDVFVKLPHNDWLRFLYEGGAILVSAMAMFWWRVYREGCDSGKIIILASLLYSLSENNVDNLLYFSFLMVFVGGILNKPDAKMKADLELKRENLADK